MKLLHAGQVGDQTGRFSPLMSRSPLIKGHQLHAIVLHQGSNFWELQKRRLFTSFLIRHIGRWILGSFKQVPSLQALLPPHLFRLLP